MIIIEQDLYGIIGFVWIFKVIIRFFIIIGIFCLLSTRFYGWFLLYYWKEDCKVREVYRQGGSFVGIKCRQFVCFRGGKLIVF
jgi:hypothetical protein